VGLLLGLIHKISFISKMALTILISFHQFVVPIVRSKTALVIFPRKLICSLLSLFPVAPTLEHRESVKRFVSLQFLNPKTVGRTPWTGDQPVARPLPNTNTD
jgi:hypothetical protein